MEEGRGFLPYGTRCALPKTSQISSDVGQELGHHIGAAVCRHALGRVMREDEIVRFIPASMASEAGLHQSFAAVGLAVFELTVPPTARVGVFLRILDTELGVCRVSGYERLDLTEDCVVFVRWNVLPSQSCDDRAVREGTCPISISFDRDVVSENGAKIVEAARFVSHADHLPVAISGRYLDAEDRRGLLIGSSGDD